MWQTRHSLEKFRYIGKLGWSYSPRIPSPSDITLYAHEFNSDPNFSDTFFTHSVLIQIRFLSEEKSSSVTKPARRHIYTPAPTFEYLKYIMLILAWSSAFEIPVKTFKFTPTDERWKIVELQDDPFALILLFTSSLAVSINKDRYTPQGMYLPRYLSVERLHLTHHPH